MRILAVTNLYPRPGREGIAPFNRQQFRALADGHELEVIAPVPWPEVGAYWRSGGPADRRRRNDDGVLAHHPTYFYTPRFFRQRYGAFYRASVRPTFERVVREFRPEVVFACWADPDGWAALSLSRAAGLPLVIKVVGSDVLTVGRQGARGRRVAEALGGADAVVAVSRDLAGHVVGLGVDPARVHVVYNGVDHGLFRPGDRSEARARVGVAADEAMILFVGNLLLSKGAGVLVEACRLLKDRGRSFRCCLIGQGRDEARLRSMVRRHGLGGCVGLVGHRPLSALPDWYRASDVVALPSFSEGIPNVLREALACGRPFVASRVGGIPEIADPSWSRLVAPGSAPELAEALEPFLGPDGGPARAPVALPSWPESARRLAAVLEAAAGRRPPSCRDHDHAAPRFPIGECR